MKVVLPECRFGQPAFHRVAEDAFSLLTDEQKLETWYIRFPNNPLDRINQIAAQLLRRYVLGESRSLTCQQSLALFIRTLALGDVRRAPHELHQIPGCVQTRMADGVDVFDGAARKKDSEFQFVFQLFSDCSIDCPLPLGSILRMSAQQTFFKSRRAIFWIESINAGPFLR